MAWPTLLDCRLRELLAHWQIITESESIKEPRGRSRSQSYSQIALLHSHLFLHDQLTFADISGTDISLSKIASIGCVQRKNTSSTLSSSSLIGLKPPSPSLPARSSNASMMPAH